MPPHADWGYRESGLSPHRPSGAGERRVRVAMKTGAKSRRCCHAAEQIAVLSLHPRVPRDEEEKKTKSENSHSSAVSQILGI